FQKMQKERYPGRSDYISQLTSGHTEVFDSRSALVVVEQRIKKLLVCTRQ
ncbi:putative Nucleolysin TIA-1 isoform p40-like protein, partial [Naja naja]